MCCAFVIWVSLPQLFCVFFFQAEDGIRYHCVTGVQTCALPIYPRSVGDRRRHLHRRSAADILQCEIGKQRLNSSHTVISYAVFCLKKKKKKKKSMKIKKKKKKKKKTNKNKNTTK